MEQLRLVVLLTLCGIVASQTSNTDRWWQKSSDPFGLRPIRAVPEDQGVQALDRRAEQSGTPELVPGKVAIPPGIFYIPENGTGDSSEQYDATLNCKCVQFYQCDANNSIITSGEGIIGIRIQDQDQDGVYNVRVCPDNLMRCCKLPPGVTAPPRSQPAVRRPPSCGLRRSSALESLLRIKAGDETEFGEFPWMLAMLKIQRTDAGLELNIFECGASLIHPQVALTAAHCVKRSSKEPNVRFKVRAGEWDTKATDELLPHQDRNVSRVILHEAYNSGSLFNDVALLVLSDPLLVADNVDTVCLPEVNDKFEGSNCVATGWGREAFGSDSAFQTVLRKVDLQVTPSALCQEELRKTRLGAHFRLNPSFVCAKGRSGQDTCRGDGGGPLACPSPRDANVYVQVGIVSWGVGCGDATPAVYANVVHQRQWIDNQLNLLGFSTGSGVNTA